MALREANADHSPANKKFLARDLNDTVSPRLQSRLKPGKFEDFNLNCSGTDICVQSLVSPPHFHTACKFSFSTWPTEIIASLLPQDTFKSYPDNSSRTRDSGDFRSP